MKLKSLIPLLVAAVLGLAAFVVGKDMFKPKVAAQVTVDMSKVLVFAKDLEPGAMLQQTDITVSNLPKDVTPHNAMLNESEAIGRVLTARVVKGQMVLNAMLAPVGTGSGLQALVPKGMRAVSVPVNQVSGLSGLLVPGCRVDLICIMADKTTGQNFARTVVQSVQVTAVGTQMSMGKDAEANASVQSVTVLTTPEQAEAISLASSEGRINLMLRSGDDDTNNESKGVTLSQLSGHPDVPVVVAPVAPSAPATQPVVVAPAVEPVAPHRTVQVIRGGNEGSVNFQESGEPMASGPNSGKVSAKSDPFSSN